MRFRHNAVIINIIIPIHQKEMQESNQDQQVCPYYSPEYKVIPQYIEMEVGKQIELNSKTANYFIFVLTGGVTISFNQYIDRPISENEMFFLPKNNKFKWKAIAKTTLILSGYNIVIFPCTSARTEILYKTKATVKFQCRGVSMKQEIKDLVYQMKHYLDAGISCDHMYLLKHKEIYLVLKHFYTYEEITQIFYMSLGSNPLFVELVLDNYLKVKTAKELANLLGYGNKTFEKLFKENFDNTPYQWMQDRKAKQIQQRLMNPSIPLKQIMYEFKFTTSSHFNFYCKQNLGGTPMQIRNSNKKNLMSK